MCQRMIPFRTFFPTLAMLPVLDCHQGPDFSVRQSAKKLMKKSKNFRIFPCMGGRVSAEKRHAPLRVAQLEEGKKE